MVSWPAPYASECGHVAHRASSASSSRVSGSSGRRPRPRSSRRARRRGRTAGRTGAAPCAHYRESWRWRSEGLAPNGWARRAYSAGDDCADRMARPVLRPHRLRRSRGADAGGPARALRRACRRDPVREFSTFCSGEASRSKPEALFDKLVRRKRGGYCFEQNGLLPRSAARPRVRRHATSVRACDCGIHETIRPRARTCSCASLVDGDARGSPTSAWAPRPLPASPSASTIWQTPQPTPHETRVVSSSKTAAEFHQIRYGEAWDGRVRVHGRGDAVHRSRGRQLVHEHLPDLVLPAAARRRAGAARTVTA